MPREILRTSHQREPDGTELVEEEWQLRPGWSALSFPPHQPGDIRFQVLDGQARLRIEATGRVYGAGESVIVAAGQSHGLVPVDDGVVHLLVQRWSRSASSIEPTT